MFIHNTMFSAMLKETLTFIWKEGSETVYLYLKYIHIITRCKYKAIWKSFSRVWLFVTPWTIQSMEFSRTEHWIGYLFPSTGFFPTQGLNTGLPHCRQILYQPSHKGCDIKQYTNSKSISHCQTSIKMTSISNLSLTVGAFFQNNK